MRNFLILSGLCLFTFKAFSQTAKDCAVEVYATVQSTPPSITLKWLSSATATNYSVARKLKAQTAWNVLAPTLAGSTTQYVDNTVNVGTAYDYRIIRNAANYTGYGYICSGIDVAAVDSRGKLILLVAETHSLTLAPEIQRLEEDMEGDGWIVMKSFVSPTMSVAQVKSLIVTAYNLDLVNTKALFLLGHIPVPYSGNISPDGHPDHNGAWPADVYYGEVTGIWTDVSVNSTAANQIRTQNIPGDGKFDQSTLPSQVELQVGRVDLFGMTSFSLTETQLLKNYLDKDHEYRKKIFSVPDAGIIDDNFGYFGGEAFAANGFKTFSPLILPANTTTGDYFTAMSTGSYKWSYGCGGGSYTSAGGIGNSSDFTTSNLNGIFTMLFGSYFGDWDVNNNFLRAPLCQGKILTSVWAGRPHWAFHHMGMGENIGYSTMATQNNVNTYFYNYGNTFIHIALMGDPTLRNNIVSPVSNVVATKSGYNCNISWSASPETNLIGYNIYMKNDTNTSYVKINTVPVTATSFTDVCLPYKAIYKYMVRAIKLETTSSGTYYNMSEGISDTALSTNDMYVISSFSTTISGSSVTAINTSSNAISYVWNFGNGYMGNTFNSGISYQANSTYTISLISSNPCHSDTSYQLIQILEVGSRELSNMKGWRMWPNPSTGKIFLEHTSSRADISIYSIDGRKIFSKTLISQNDELDLSSFDKGSYLFQVVTDGKTETRHLVLQ